MPKTNVYGTRYSHTVWFLADRVEHSPISRIKNNVPLLALTVVFRYTGRLFSVSA